MKNRNYSIDLLKVIATFGVVALHSQRSLVTGALYNPILYYMARFSMPIFFMCNGYLIMQKESFSMKYLVNKTINIVRIMGAWSLISILISLIVDHTTIKQSIINGIKCFLGANIAPFWFLYTLIAIYGILFFSFNFCKKHIIKITSILFVIMLIFDVLSYISILNGGYFVQDLINQRFRLWTWLFYFFSGYILGQRTDKSAIKKHFVLSILFTILAIVVQYYTCCIILKKINSEYMYDNIIIIIWAMSIFALFFSLSIKENKAILFLNANSFGVFLLHPFLINYLSLTERITGWLEASILWIVLTSCCYILTFLCRKIKYIRTLFEY